MNIYRKLGVKTFINAYDSETVLGGSRMPEEVVQAMAEASKYFVRIEELEEKISQKISELTYNEACFITNGAAAGLAISVSACITEDCKKSIEQLPNLDGLKNEVIVHACQRNGFDHAIRQTGAKIVEIGDMSRTNEDELEAAVTKETACIVYFAGSTFEQAALPIEDVIAFGNKRSIPVIIDAAAQLPPIENLWKFTKQGADLVIFSGGKTLRGPQATGFILGKKKWIHSCKLNASPNHSIGRSMKVGKEEMVGLLYALKRYIQLDHVEMENYYENCVQQIIQELQGLGLDLDVKRLFPGPVGQSYPRVAIQFHNIDLAKAIKNRLEDGSPSIVTKLSSDKTSIIINPLHLTVDEVRLIIKRLKEILTT